MSGKSLSILAVIGSLHRESVTGAVINHVAQQLRKNGCAVDVLDLQAESLPLYNPDTAYDTPAFDALQARAEKADVFVLGTPDYHGSISSVLKNFLDHFWREFAGKLFVTIVASHEKGLTVTDQLRTVARQCYAWTLPYGVSFTENVDVKDGRIVSDTFRKRLKTMVRDARGLRATARETTPGGFGRNGTGFPGAASEIDSHHSEGRALRVPGSFCAFPVAAKARCSIQPRITRFPPRTSERASARRLPDLREVFPSHRLTPCSRGSTFFP